MLKRCFVANCQSSYDKENNVVSMFSVPKIKLEEWQEIMKHKSGFTNNSRFCSRDFNEEDIDKGRVILGVFHPMQWRLKKNAQPSLHLGCY